MTRGAKKTREAERNWVQMWPQSQTTEGKFRINLPLPRSPHACTHKHTQSSNVLPISGDNIFISICIYLHFLPTDTHTHTHKLTHYSADMDTPSQICACAYWYVHIQPGQKQGYKHDQMPLWFHTGVYSHAQTHTHTHIKVLMGLVK